MCVVLLVSWFFSARATAATADITAAVTARTTTVAVAVVAAHQDAEENLGETEVRDALHAKATFLAKIGDREAAAAAYKDTEDKTASGGSKADMVFSQIR